MSAASTDQRRLAYAAIHGGAIGADLRKMGLLEPGGFAYRSIDPQQEGPR